MIPPIVLDEASLLAPLPPIRYRQDRVDWSDRPQPVPPPIPTACPSCGCRSMVVCRNKRDVDVSCFMCGRDPRR